MNKELALLLFRINRSKPLKYSIGAVFALLTLLFFNQIVFRGSSSSVGSEYDGITEDGYDLSNTEVNNLLASKNVLDRRELMDFELKSPYLNNDLEKQNYEFNGNILLRNNHYVRLTEEKKHQSSSFFSNNKLDDSSFIMEFKFSVHGKGDVTGFHGDGFAILFTTEKLPEGELFGVNEFYNGFAIYIDTYRNGKSGVFPYVMAALNDGTQPYDKDNDGKANEISGCIARSLWNPHAGLTRGRFTYIRDGYVSLDFDYNNNGEWTNCFTLQDIYLPESMYVGFASQTGDLHENVDIMESHIYQLYDYTGKPISQFERIVEILDDPNSPDKFKEVVQEYKANDNTRRSRRVTERKDVKKTRKTLRRLKNAEKRIKKEAEERRRRRKEAISSFFGSIKKYFYIMILLVIAYFLTVVVRVQRRKQLRKQRATGLLS